MTPPGSMPVARIILSGRQLAPSLLSTAFRPIVPHASRLELPGRCCRCAAAARWIHASRPLGQGVASDNAASMDHYARLGVRPDASPAEIKKSFYALSKTHHPDVNRSDPGAARTFSLISESYTVLSDPSRRAVYDRDHMRRQHHANAGRRTGSYSSTAGNPAGGRAPSGLSRRRGTFRGPSPSFYRNGGWGAHADARRRAHEESTGMGPDGAWRDKSSGTSSSSSSSSSSSADAAGSAGGMGPGSTPFHHPDFAAPHFDRRAHKRTHDDLERRRWQRQRRAVDDEGIEFEPQTSVGAHFVIVSCILGATVFGPFAYLQMTSLGKRKKQAD